MKNVLIAGCGHGGLVCAYNLAKAGYKVTVFEKKLRDEMGYDWEDCISRHIFERAGLPHPGDENFGPFLLMGYTHPSKKIRLVPSVDENSPTVTIERKFLIDYLIANCLEAGVEIEFGVEVKAAVVYRYHVTGLVIEKDGKEEKVHGDIVIDAAGMDSPVRKSLPEACGIHREIDDSEVFFCYRAYFENVGSVIDDPPYNVCFYHCGNQGMDWAITTPRYVDILVGSFAKIDRDIIDAAIADYREQYPNMGSEVLRGGIVAKIPLRRAIPMFVCNGYAAIGDCASMVEPMSGSGISISFEAGKMLADTIIEAGEEKLTRKVLWNYEYKYMSGIGKQRVADDVLKNMIAVLSAQDIDYLFEKNILTEKELASGSAKYTFKEIIDKAALVKRPAIVKALGQMALRSSAIDSVFKLLPKEYDEKQVRQFTRRYDILFG